MGIPEPRMILFYDQVAITLDRLGCDELLARYEKFAESKNMLEMMIKYYWGVTIRVPPESMSVTFTITS